MCEKVYFEMATLMRQLQAWRRCCVWMKTAPRGMLSLAPNLSPEC